MKRLLNVNTEICLFCLILCFSVFSLSACDSKNEGSGTEAGMQAGMEEASDMGGMNMEMMSDLGPQTTIDDRCPNARAGVQLLVFYPDRIEAFNQDEVGFKVERTCTFIAHAEQGATQASGMTVDSEGRFFIVSPEGEAGGSVYVYTNNGEFERKSGLMDLKDVARIWTINDGFVVWISRNGSLYKLNQEGEFVGAYTPPEQGSSRLPHLTNLEYIGDDEEGRPRILALFDDRSPQLFAFPNSPTFDDMGAANALSIIDTPVGKKILVTGIIEGTTRGVGKFSQVTSGRMAPAYEETLVYETDPGFGDGTGIASFEDGFFILDSGENGTRPASLNSFNTSGVPQEPNELNLMGTPLQLTRTLIFSGF